MNVGKVRKFIKIIHGVPTKWHWVVWYPENCNIHPNVDIGSHTDIFGQCGVEIQEGVQIGAGCRIYSKNTIDGTEGFVKIMRGACLQKMQRSTNKERG